MIKIKASLKLSTHFCTLKIAVTDLTAQPTVKSILKQHTTYLSSYCAVLFFWWGRFKNPLLLLRRKGRIQWNDFDVTHFRTQVINFTFYPLAGFINLLQNNNSGWKNSKGKLIHSMLEHLITIALCLYPEKQLQ